MYKTSLCVQFERGGCPNKEHCRYAHGVEELKVREETPQFVPKKAIILPHPDRLDSEDEHSSDSSFSSDEEDDKASFLSDKEAFMATNGGKQIFKHDMGSWGLVANPEKFRYNYMNPFYFYSMNNFPVQQFNNGEQTLPIFNYVGTLEKKPSLRAEFDKLGAKNADAKFDSEGMSRFQTLSDANINEMLEMGKNGFSP